MSTPMRMHPTTSKIGAPTQGYGPSSGVQDVLANWCPSGLAVMLALALPHAITALRKISLTLALNTGRAGKAVVPNCGFCETRVCSPRVVGISKWCAEQWAGLHFCGHHFHCSIEACTSLRVVGIIALHHFNDMEVQARSMPCGWCDVGQLWNVSGSVVSGSVRAREQSCQILHPLNTYSIVVCKIFQPKPILVGLA